ncbi:hypothetical protein QE152_g39657 [Popillia japonica]|uniref:Uncharacterized protein n=1 Tax=Popillia japonica TaxID=7064 RepID=A0AAW1HTL2_POPJA
MDGLPLLPSYVDTASGQVDHGLLLDHPRKAQDDIRLQVVHWDGGASEVHTIYGAGIQDSLLASSNSLVACSEAKLHGRYGCSGSSEPFRAHKGMAGPCV